MSIAATKRSYLKVRPLDTLNSMLKRIKNQSETILYQSSDPGTFQLEAISDAAMNVLNEKTNVKEGISILRRSNNIVNAIGWVSRLERRVERSTSTAEFLATADAADQLAYLKLLMEKILEHPTAELILDSRTTFCSCSTFKKPEKEKVNIGFDS